MNRRTFVKLLGTSLAATALPPLTGCGQTPRARRVIIIGAGMAGSAANDVFRRAGWHTILIEARDRIGGRVWTNSSGFDLGASWIHGRTGNPLINLVSKTSSPTFAFDYDNMWRYDQGGELSDRADRQIDTDMESIEADIARAQRRARASDSLKPTVDSAISRLPSSRRNGARYAVNTGIVHEYAADTARLSLAHFDGGAEQRGGDLLLPAGYIRLFEALSAASELHLGCVVSRISHTNTSVTVSTNKGDFTADAAIVTLPLGVLKSGRVVFAPKLPAAHQNAINRLGYGTLNKLYLEFPRVAWPANPHLFGYVGDGWWEEWVNLQPVLNKPVLLGFNAGAIAENSESRTDSQLAESAMRVLRNMFGRALPDPVRVTATRWKSDPFSLGSYSSWAPGSTPADRTALAAPISPRLILAGEACSRDHPATVHGAYSSGVAAAQRIIQNLA